MRERQVSCQHHTDDWKHMRRMRYVANCQIARTICLVFVHCRRCISFMSTSLCCIFYILMTWRNSDRLIDVSLSSYFPLEMHMVIGRKISYHSTILFVPDSLDSVGVELIPCIVSSRGRSCRSLSIAVIELLRLIEFDSI